MVQIDTLYNLLHGNVHFDLECGKASDLWHIPSDTRVMIGACLSSGDTFVHRRKKYAVVSKALEEDFLVIIVREIVNAD